MIALSLAYRNVLRRRERSLLTLIGVMLAIASYVALVSLAEGLYERVSRELGGRNVDLYILPDSAAPLPTGPVGTLGLTTDTVALPWVERLGGLPNVRRAAGVIRTQWTGRRGTVMVLGIDPTALTAFLPGLSKIEGDWMEPGQLMLGAGVALQEEKGPGDQLGPSQSLFQVAGVVEGGGFQDYFAYLPLETAIKESNAKGVGEIWIQLEDPHRSPEVAASIRALEIPEARVLTRKEYLGSANDYIEYLWMLQFAVAAIGVLIAVTAAMNTMLMSTYERMREFSTLRAIGAPRPTVVAMVVCESLILSSLGGGLGIVFGWIGAALFDRAMVFLLQLAFPLGSVTWGLLAQAVAVSLLVGLVGSAIPSWLVWRQHLVSGLKGE